MEKRGIRTERGNLNREIEVTNQRLRQLKARIVKLQNWLKEESENIASPTLADVIQGILSRREQTGQPSRYSTINYHETYRTEIAMYDNAEKYLRDVLQGHFDIKKLPPITKWQAEREKLAADKKRLDRQYAELRNETAAVEKIKRNVDDILREETRVTQRTRRQGMEL